MTYILEEITPDIWEMILGNTPPDWRIYLTKQHWEEVALTSGIAMNAEKNCYLCSAPTFIRDEPSRWYFFGFQGTTYCFRVRERNNALIEFLQNNIPHDIIYDSFKKEVRDAFSAYGQYGIPDAEIIKFALVFPAPGTAKTPPKAQTNPWK